MKNFDVKVVPGAKKNVVVPNDESGRIKVYLTAPPVDGKANQALVRVLAEHYQVRLSQVTIIKGLKSRIKTVRIVGIL